MSSSSLLPLALVPSNRAILMGSLCALLLFVVPPLLRLISSSASRPHPPASILSVPLTSFLFWTAPFLWSRMLYRLVPLSAQHAIRDGGLQPGFDALSVIMGIVGLLMTAPTLILQQLVHRNGRVRNIKYGDDVRQQLDVYYTHRNDHAETTKLSPVVLFVHGGAWGSGNKYMYSLFGNSIDIELNAVCVVMNYRLWPYATANGQCEDIHSALLWCKRHIRQFGGDENAMFLCGHSSGAHIATLFASRQFIHQTLSASESSEWLSSISPLPLHPYIPIRGIINLSGVYDIATHYEYEMGRGVHEISPMKPANGNIVLFDRHSPLRTLQYATQCAATKQQSASSAATSLTFVPQLCLHGDDDGTVPYTQQETWIAAVDEYHRQQGLNESQCRDMTRHATIHDADHASVIIDTMLNRGDVTTILSQMNKFIDAALKHDTTHDDTLKSSTNGRKHNRTNEDNANRTIQVSETHKVSRL